MEINHNFIRLNDLCNLLNIRITHLFHRTLDTRWHFDDHRNDYNRLYLILDGHGCLYNDNERVELEPYNMYLIPAYSSYNYRCEKYMEQIFIHYKLCIIPNRDLLSNIDHIVTIPCGKEKAMEIKDGFYKENVCSAVLCQKMLREISFRLLGPYMDEIDRDIAVYKKYSKLFRYIELNLSAAMSVPEVCASMGFSQTYLGRQFKADTGETIKSYISERLLDRMKQLLQLDLPLKEISDSLGFSDISYCSKFFKKHMGINPSAYAKRHKGLIKQEWDMP